MLASAPLISAVAADNGTDSSRRVRVAARLAAMTVTVQISRSVPAKVDAIGVPVATSGVVPRSLGLSRAALEKAGFEGKPGQTLALPSATGPTQIAVGIGEPSGLSTTVLRNAAAATVRAAGKRATVATTAGRPGWRRRDEGCAGRRRRSACSPPIATPASRRSRTRAR